MNNSNDSGTFENNEGLSDQAEQNDNTASSSQEIDLAELQKQQILAYQASDDAKGNKIGKQIEDYLASQQKQAQEQEEQNVESDEPDGENEPPEATETESSDESSADTKGNGERKDKQSEAKEGRPTNKKQPAGVDAGGDEDESKLVQQALGALKDPKLKGHIEKILKDKQALEHRIKADDGRVAAYQGRYHESQKRIKELESKIQQLSSSRQAAPPTGSQSAKSPGNSTVDDDLANHPDFKAIAETDEQLARFILEQRQKDREERARLEAQIQELRGEVTPLKQTQQESFVNSEVEKLKSYVSNADEIINSPAWDEFLDVAPPGIKSLANSSYADDVVIAIQAYGSWAQSTFGAPQQQQEEAPSEQGAQQTDERVQRAQQSRDRKLSAKPVGSTATPPTTQRKPTLEEIANDPVLYEKAFQENLQKELKAMGLAK